MAVSFVNATVVAEASVANTSYAAPASIVNGDLLLLWHFEYNGASAAPTATPPSGFSVVPGATWPALLAAPTTNDAAQYLWYKIAASESGAYVVTHTTTVTRGILAHVTGNDSTTPFEVNPTQSSALFGTSGSTTTFTGLTTAVASELILCFASDDNDSGGNLTPPTGSTPTFTEQIDDNHGNYLCTGVLASAGATGNKTMTNNSASGGGVGYFSSMVAVQPSAGGGGSAGHAFIPHRMLLGA